MLSLTILLILIPLIAGLLLLVLKDVTSSKIIAVGASVLNLLLGLYMASIFKTTKFDFNLAWIEKLKINIHLGFDGLSMIMVLLVALLFCLIVLSSLRFEYAKKASFFGLILIAEAFLIGVFAAKDAFLFYFFFEAALIPVYFLATRFGGSDTPKHAFKMFMYTLFGSLFMLLTLVFLYYRAGNSELSSFSHINLSTNEQYIVFGALVLAFGIKMPLFPFHGWQPDIYTSGPTTSTMILGGVMSKMGVYGLVRFLIPITPIAVKDLGLYVSILAVIGLLYGSIVAIKQRQFKKILAYSSFAHMGLMAAGVLSYQADGIQGAVLQMFAHGVNTIGLFLMAKLVYDRTQTRDIYQLGGIAAASPVFTVSFIIIMLGSVALPLTNGFPGEFLLLKSVFTQNKILGICAGVSVILGAVYMLRLTQFVLFGERSEHTLDFKPPTQLEATLLIVVSALVIIMGLCPSIITDIYNHSPVGLVHY